MAVSIELVDAFAAGFYVLFAVLQFDLWMRRRARRSHLWLAGASAGALIVDLSGMALRRLGDEPAVWLLVLNNSGVALATLCLYELVVSLGDEPVGRPVRVLEGVVLSAALLPLVSRHAGADALTQLLCAGLLLAAIARALRAGRGGDREARAIGRAFLFLTALLAVDVMMNLRAIPLVPGLPVLGFAVLFLAAARSLNERVEREHRELLELRRELEQRVEARTLELSEANERLAKASRTDELTQLPNRRAFVEAAGLELARAQRSGRSPALVMLDLDHFKEVNDRYGHAAGDEVLRSVATVLRQSLRGQDLVARWGGEEFILLLPETDRTGATQVAEAIRRAIGELVVQHVATTIHLTASLGVARLFPGGSLDEGAAQADRALYRAKEKGRNRVEVGQPGAPAGPEAPATEPPGAARELGAVVVPG